MAEYYHFDMWLSQVDEQLYRICGLTSSDLPAQPFYSWYDSGMGAVDAAYEALATERLDY